MNAFHTLLAALFVAPALAGEVDVLDAHARCNEARTCVIQATLRHADTGWDHYAVGWEVLDAQGEVLATRVLRHPHVKEQPFTRALQGVEIPEGVEEVTIRAHDSVHGHGGRNHTIRLAAPTGNAAAKE